jgi:serine/threonine protein kinase
MSSSNSNSNTEELSESSDENMDNLNNIDLTCNIIKHYNVIYELGRGSFSIVWLVYNILNNNFYALKVQNPDEYADGLSEIKFVQKLPKIPNVFNNIVEYFIEEIDKQKFLCSVWELHCTNIDSLLRKGQFTNGFDYDSAINIMKQLVLSVKILHENYRVFHGDIKSDNILVKGINNKDKFIMDKYKEANFPDTFRKAKDTVGNKLNTKTKIAIRKTIHKTISLKIIEDLKHTDIDNHNIDNKYLNNMSISLADFGTHCEAHNYYEESFGTRYYQAPEIILMGKCNYSVDIWALGCTFFEILTGDILFDPNKDAYNPRDYYHLCLINETCGDFPYYFLKKTKKYKLFFDSKYKIKNFDIEDGNRLYRKLSVITLPTIEMDLVKKLLIHMLQIYYKDRYNINDILLEINNFNNK